MDISKSYSEGIYFGLTEGTVTTTGIIIGMYASVKYKLAIVGAVLTAAFCDSFGDSIGIYYSELDKNPDVIKKIIGMCLSKILISILYVLPIIFLKKINNGLIISLILAFIIILYLLKYLAKLNKREYKKFIVKNLTLIIFVIIISYCIGLFLKKLF